jgi:hypothetical protein
MTDPQMPPPETEKEKQLRLALYRIIGFYPQLELMYEAAHQGLDLAYPEQAPKKAANAQ